MEKETNKQMYFTRKKLLENEKFNFELYQIKQLFGSLGCSLDLLLV